MSEPEYVGALGERILAFQRRRDAQPKATCTSCEERWVVANLTDGVCPVCVERRRDASARVSRLAIPERYRGLGVEHPTLAEWTENVVEGLERGGVILHGLAGTHKTGNALAALVRASQAGMVGIEWENLLWLVRGRNLDDQRERVEALANANLVLLDDLGSWKDFAFADDVLLLILDRRHSRNLPTIVTTNLRPGTAEIPAAVGARNASRLGSYLPILFAGPDDRLRP